MNILLAAIREYVADTHPGWELMSFVNSDDCFSVSKPGATSSYILISCGLAIYMAVFYSGGCLATYSYTEFNALERVSICIKMLEEMGG